MSAGNDFARNFQAACLSPKTSKHFKTQQGSSYLTGLVVFNDAVDEPMTKIKERMITVTGGAAIKVPGFCLNSVDVKVKQPKAKVKR